MSELESVSDRLGSVPDELEESLSLPFLDFFDLDLLDDALLLDTDPFLELFST